MTLRLRFFVRVAAALAISLMAIQLILVWFYIQDRASGEEPGYRFPLPERVAALVEIVEATPGTDRALVALNGPDFRVDIVTEEIFDFVAPETKLRGVERHFEDYASLFGARPFALFADIPPGLDPAGLRWGDRSVWTPYPIRILVGLQDGRVLSIETRDDLLTQVYSVPLGWYSGVFGLIASLIVLFFVRRETKPIITLAHAVEQFGRDGAPVAVPAQGGPELQSLIQNFNAMQTRISDLMARQVTMLGALGHDMRTYLTRLTLRVEDAPDELRPALQSNIDKLGRVVESSLDFARVGSLSATKEHVSIRPFLTDWVAEKQDSRITLGLCDDAHLSISPVALDRILTNLVENGLRFGTRVVLTATGAPLSLRVMDDGPGIPEDALDRVLEPFVTLDTARTADRSGTGLGLAITALLVRDAGGHLALSNRAQGGLCAAVHFPAIAEP